MSKKVGRPKQEIKRSKMLKIRVTPEEQALFTSKAAAQGGTVSEMVRTVVLGSTAGAAELNKDG